MRSVAPAALPAVEIVAAYLASAPPQQPWLHEGEVRAALRAMACLAGKPWHRSDVQAAITIERARRAAGIAEPIGWDQDEHDGKCLHCRKSFTRSPRTGEQLYCSEKCQTARSNALRANPRPLPTTCETCEQPMDAKTPKQKFCGIKCRRAAEKARWDARMDEERERDPTASWRELRKRVLAAAA